MTINTAATSLFVTAMLLVGCTTSSPETTSVRTGSSTSAVSADAEPNDSTCSPATTNLVESQAPRLVITGVKYNWLPSGDLQVSWLTNIPAEGYVWQGDEVMLKKRVSSSIGDGVNAYQATLGIDDPKLKVSFRIHMQTAAGAMAESRLILADKGELAHAD